MGSHSICSSSIYLSVSKNKRLFVITFYPEGLPENRYIKKKPGGDDDSYSNKSNKDKDLFVLLLFIVTPAILTVTPPE